MTTWIIVGVLLIIAVIGIFYLTKMRDDHGGVPEPVEGCKNALTGGRVVAVLIVRISIRNRPLFTLRTRSWIVFVIEVGEITQAKRSQSGERSLTLRPEELDPWLKSVGLRGLHVPQELLKELNNH